MPSDLIHGPRKFRGPCPNLATPYHSAAPFLLVLAGLLVVSQPTSAADGEFVNISTRALVETGNEVMIGGFIIRDGPKYVLIQALGPELVNRGVSNFLADPVLRVIGGDGKQLAANDNWDDTQGPLISDAWNGQPPFAPGSLDSAVILTLNPGNYTAIAEGKDGATGVALVEVYDIDSSGTDGEFVNISTRALVETGDEVMIGGFIVRDGPKYVLIQALGPELVHRGVSNYLADPVLRVIGGDGKQLAVNDNWDDTQGPLISDAWNGQTPFAPGSLDSAVILTLNPGNYTAIVEGKGGATGVALVEVYGIDSVGSENSDFMALTALYNATDGANWNDRTNWLSDAPLEQWYGVTVDGNGRVIHLHLSGNQLSGPIPAQLANLNNLEKLILDNNQLSGPIPAELGRLTNLQRLALAGNQLGGPIPEELGNLANLQWLHLDDNQLNGTIPVKLGLLTSLKGLGLQANQLGGPIPAELGRLTNLEVLHLNNNQLNGAIPVELGNLANLGWLWLSDNQLSGAIPVELGKLANLQWLWLSNNRHSGAIPAQLGNLANLQWLNLRFNQLSGPIPVQLGNLANLQRLDLQFNQLSGPIPVQLGNLANLEIFTDPMIYNDNVFVLPVWEDLAAGDLPLNKYATRFYDYFGDAFDFLIFFPSLSWEELDSNAFKGADYLGVGNDVQGMGVGIFFDGSWGSAGKLQGRLFFSSVSASELNHSRLVDGPMLHELMHRWANFIVEPKSHWDFTSANGILGGFDLANLVDHGGGLYSAPDVYTGGWALNLKPYSPIELYLAGLIPPEEVPDLWVAEDGEILSNAFGNWDGRSFTASHVRTYTIEDIIAKHGPRVPNHTQSQKAFRAAVILLVNRDYPATLKVLGILSNDATLFSHAGEDKFDKWYNFYEATGGRATIAMDGLSKVQRGVAADRPSVLSFGTPPPPIRSHCEH